jgi:lipopolysaccharide biosynthesis glycosyltransferase
MSYHVVYCFDQNYEKHFGASVTSLLLNFRKPANSLNIHIITAHNTPEFLARIDMLRSMFIARINVISVENEIAKAFLKAPIMSRHINHVTHATWYRLLIPELLPRDAMLALYLDADTIVQECVSELFEKADLKAPVQGVADLVEARLCRHHNLRQYINTGVLILNLNEWRKEDHSRKCFSMALSATNKLLFLDQCAINLYFEDAIQKIPSIWNQFITNQSSVEPDCRGILHYVTDKKPWHSWYRNTAGEIYWRYRKVSPWRDGQPDSPITLEQHIEYARKMTEAGNIKGALMAYDSLLSNITKYNSSKS